MEDEIWKDIPGWEGLYQASSLGRIRSLNYMGRGETRVIKQTISCSTAHKNHKVLVVGLFKNGKRRTFLVHRLVLMSFVPNTEGKPNVDHIDGDSLNNRVSNLRWVTQMENVHNPNTFWKNVDVARKNIARARLFNNTEDAIRKKTESLINRYKTIKHHRVGCKHTQETKDKIGSGNKGKCFIPILQYSTDGVFIREWDGIIEAARSVGVGATHISRCCKGYQRQSAGFIWKYKNG